MPTIEIDCVEDLYSLYVFIFGIDPHDFWHLPFKSVQKMATNKAVFSEWKALTEEELMKNG